MHRQDHEDDFYDVVSGEFDFQVGDRRVRVPAQSFVFIPKKNRAALTPGDCPRDWGDNERVRYMTGRKCTRPTSSKTHPIRDLSVGNANQIHGSHPPKLWTVPSAMTITSEIRAVPGATWVAPLPAAVQLVRPFAITTRPDRCQTASLRRTGREEEILGDVYQSRAVPFPECQLCGRPRRPPLTTVRDQPVAAVRRGSGEGPELNGAGISQQRASWQARE